jgi:hypothetical protein
VWWRAGAAWLGLLVVAVVNGAVRESAMTPRFGGAAAHRLSTLTLCALILAVTWLLMPWVHPETPRAAWRVGLAWVGLTLAFEFLAGHYLFGRPWAQLIADYDVRAGRIWPVVLVTTLVAPRFVGALRGTWGGGR